MAKQKKAPKDPYGAVSREWRDAVDAAQEQEIKDKLAAVALDQQAVLDEKAADQDFQSKKSALKFAGEGYKERSKVHKLKIQYARRVLQGRGRA